MMTAITISVSQVLAQKSSKVFSVTPHTNIYDALALMAKHNIGAVLVSENDQLKGIFTERDYARKIVLKGLNSHNVKVGEMMSTDLHTVPSSEQLASVMTVMTQRRFRHVPVIDNGKLVGLISIGDVVKAIMEQQEATITHLANYIAGDIAT